MQRVNHYQMFEEMHRKYKEQEKNTTEIGKAEKIKLYYITGTRIRSSHLIFHFFLIIKLLNIKII